MLEYITQFLFLIDHGYFGFTRRNLFDTDGLRGTVDDTVADRTAGTVVRGADITDIGHRMANADRNDRAQHGLRKPAEAVAFIDQNGHILRLIKFGDHNGISQVMEIADPAIGQKALLGEAAHRKRKQTRRHSLRHMIRTCMHDTDAVIRTAQIDLQVRQRAFKIALGNPSFDQRRIKPLPQKRQAVLIIRFEFPDILTFIDFPVEGIMDPGKHLLQFLTVDRLENIFLCLKADRLLGIFKFIKTRKDDDPGIRPVFLQTAGKFQPVHVGHLDIRHHHIRLGRLCDVKRLESVGRIARLLEADGIPVDLAGNGLCDLFLVIHQHYGIQSTHTSPPSSAMPRTDTHLPEESPQMRYRY